MGKSIKEGNELWLYDTPVSSESFQVEVFSCLPPRGFSHRRHCPGSVASGKRVLFLGEGPRGRGRKGTFTSLPSCLFGWQFVWFFSPRDNNHAFRSIYFLKVWPNRFLSFLSHHSQAANTGSKCLKLISNIYREPHPSSPKSVFHVFFHVMVLSFLYLVSSLSLKGAGTCSNLIVINP